MKRGAPVLGSSPMVETKMPTAPETMPFPMLSGVITAMVESPKRHSQKLSGPPNWSANRAKDPARHSRNTVPTMPPKAEDKSDVYSPISASPFWHSGQPSNVVATEEGVPGVQMRMAEFAPP